MGELKKMGLRIEDLEYVGGDKDVTSESVFRKRARFQLMRTGIKLKRPQFKKTCLCGHDILHNMYIRDFRSMGQPFVVGSHCVRRFDNRKTRFCYNCSRPHKNTSTDLCSRCRTEQKSIRKKFKRIVRDGIQRQPCSKCKTRVLSIHISARGLCRICHLNAEDPKALYDYDMGCWIHL